MIHGILFEKMFYPLGGLIFEKYLICYKNN